MLSAYETSVGVTVRALRNLDTLLRAGETHALNAGLEPADLLAARLAPDMLPLGGQVQRASDSAKLGVARLLGITAPRFADEETSFAEFYARIAKTVAFLEPASPEGLEAGLDRTIEIRAGGVTRTLVGRDYLLKFMVPNFFFHIAIAHGILRAAGVPIGKMDYLGAF